MKRFALKSLAASSFLLVSIMAWTGTRPQYGRTTRVAMRIAPSSLDPLDSSQPDSVARRNLARMLFDTLVTIDDFGRFRPALAVSWEGEPDNQKWRFTIRSGVTFADGSPLTPTVVAAALRSANPSWNVYANDGSVSIALPVADPMLPASLAQARNSIVRRTPAGLSGTGPFHVADWQPGKRLVAAANEEYWNGRPFLDSVQVEFGASYRDQQVALDLNKADVVEIAPEQAKRAALEGRRVISSAPCELMAILFSRDRQSPEDGKLRRALALSLDRASIRDVLLQGTGTAAGGILPNWMTGYEFLFVSEPDMQKAREQRIEVAQAPVWTIGYDAADPLSRLVAERVALSARDAGIPAQNSVLNVDLRVVRVMTPSLNPQSALAGISAALGLPVPRFANGSFETLYETENSVLQNQRLIPLIHLPLSYGVNSRVKNWEVGRDGMWALANAWLATEKP